MVVNLNLAHSAHRHPLCWQPLCWQPLPLSGP